MRVLILWVCFIMGFPLFACEDDVRPRSENSRNDNDPDDTSSPRDTDILEQECDDEGNCFCLKLAVIGTSDSTANENDVAAFRDWLNTKSSCQVSMFEERTTLTPEFLAEYDLVLLQLLGDTAYGPFWTYSSSEIDALREWVEAGGGLISLTGYNGNASAEEVAAVNGLIQPVTGISYNNDRYLADTGACNTCWCWGNSVPIYGWDPAHEISKDISQVGALWGYSINAPDDATIVATEAGKNAAVAREIGQGRVFVFADEWVIFTNQWRDGDTTPGNSADENNVCYDMEKQQFNNAENYFQIPQFWYNVIKWVAPPNDCFIIHDPVIVV